MQIIFVILAFDSSTLSNTNLLELSDIQITKDKIFISPRHLLKQTKPGKHLDMIVLKAYPKDEYLCIVKVFSEYLERTKGLRVDNKLLISTVKPHKSVSKSTVSRWVKFIMSKAGINSCFKPHSTRAAATSKAKLYGVPLDIIIKTAGWSKASVFTKFYNKPILSKTKTVQDAVLGPVVQSVISLTSSLRVISLTVLAYSMYNILIFFAEKM